MCYKLNVTIINCLINNWEKTKEELHKVVNRKNCTFIWKLTKIEGVALKDGVSLKSTRESAIMLLIPEEGREERHASSYQERRYQSWCMLFLSIVTQLSLDVAWKYLFFLSKVSCRSTGFHIGCQFWVFFCYKSQI